jgi:hypothetical protein
LVAAAGIALAASPARSGLADVLAGTLSLHGAQVVPGNPANPANALVAAQTPVLSATQTAAATSLLRADKAVTKLLGGVAYKIEHVGPWTTGGYPNRPIGVVFFIALSRPATVSAKWPLIQYIPTTAFPDYIRRSDHATVVGLRDARVNVDLGRHEVVAVIPTTFKAEHE